MKVALAKTVDESLTSLEYRLRRLKYALRGSTFSHSNEQQILSRYIAELLPENSPRTVVDIGAGNGMRWSNTYALFLAGWKGVGIEADLRKSVQLTRAYRYFPDVKACHSEANPHNIIQLLKSLNIETDFSVLSLDIDGNDYWVLKAILSAFRPSLIVTEINEKIPPPIRFVVRFEPDFQLRHHFYGYSIATLADLCEDHDYGILALEYNNAFLTPKELGGDRFIGPEQAYQQGYVERPNRKRRFSTNADVEILQSLSPAEAITFLREFYAKEAGNYFLGLEKTAPVSR